MYRVGELAALARVSVRTLHHYEAIGLLVPSARTEAGHRMYAASDLSRLTRIKALTALGFSLDEARRCLSDEAYSPLRLVEAHLERARESLDEQRQLWSGWSACATICSSAATRRSSSSKRWRC